MDAPGGGVEGGSRASGKEREKEALQPSRLSVGPTIESGVPIVPAQDFSVSAGSHETGIRVVELSTSTVNRRREEEDMRSPEREVHDPNERVFFAERDSDREVHGTKKNDERLQDNNKPPAHLTPTHQGFSPTQRASRTDRHPPPARRPAPPPVSRTGSPPPPSRPTAVTDSPQSSS